MALPNADVMRQAYWIAWQQEHGVAPEDILVAFTRRFPGVPFRQQKEAAREADRLQTVGERVQRLPLESQLREALGRGAEPDPLVGVPVLFHWEDAAGREYWNTVKVNATWEMTHGQVLDLAAQMLTEIMGRYPGAIYRSGEVVPKVLWPFPEQL